MTNKGSAFTTSFIAVFCWVVAAAAQVQESPQATYVGASTCGMCHKSEKQGNQYQIWQDSLHAQAFVVLQTDEARKIAEEKGLGSRPDTAEACLRCHATGYNVEKSLLGKKFKIEEGIQCETCHGAGSEYKSLKIMRDRQLAIQKGLSIRENLEELCAKCHNPESPTFASSDFEAMWVKIEYNLPRK